MIYYYYIMSSDSETKNNEHMVRFLNTLQNELDLKKDYNLTELKLLVTDVYKNTKRKRKNAENGEKKKPSEYNIFVKDEMKRIKEENPNIDAKELLKQAANAWRNRKQ